MTLTMGGLSQRVLQLLDGVVVFWVVLWLLVGTATGVQIWRLSRLSDTAEVSAGAVDRAGKALLAIGELPLVGETPTELGTEIRDAAAEIEERAARTRADVRRLSVLLGLSTFAIPVTPIVGLYLPLRLRRRAEVRSIRRSLRTAGGTGPASDPGPLAAYLARRAVHHLSFAELVSVTADPLRDLETGRHGALAAAELRRLGIDPPDYLRTSEPGGLRR